MDIYKFAAKNRLRFPSSVGELTVEQLFQLPLKSHMGRDLDSVARAVNADLKSVTEESFVEENPDPRKESLSIALEIVKDIIKTKLDESAAERGKRDRMEKRKKILDAIAAKDDAALSSATREDLEKQLAALDS